MALCCFDLILNVLDINNSIGLLLTRWFDRSMKVDLLVPIYFSKCGILYCWPLISLDIY
jgi:hypothetical protein